MSKTDTIWDRLELAISDAKPSGLTWVHVDDLRAILARAEKAKAALTALLDENAVLRTEKAEAERDTVWNDAIEAAALTQTDKANYWSSLCNDDERCHYEAIANEILTLKKGNTP